MGLLLPLSSGSSACALLGGLLSALLSGCPAAYVPGSLDALALGAPPGAVSATGECVELRISQAVESEVPPGYLILEYELGNRCRHPARLDLSRAEVHLRGMAGIPSPMPVYDPRSEIREASLDGRHSVWERLAYRLPPGEPEEPPPVEAVCIDVTRIAEGMAPERLCIPGSALALRWAGTDEPGEEEPALGVWSPRGIKEEGR